VVRTPHSGIRIVEFSPEDVLEIFEVREALEGMAARLAARNADAEDVAWLERVLEDHLAAEELKMNAGYYQSAGQYDFHFAVIQISGNAQLIRQCDNIYYPLRMFRYLSSQVDGRARAAHAEHARIIAAIREGDGERAEMRMRDHVRESRATFEKRLSRERADGPRPVAETTRGGHAHEPAEQRRRGA
jgi:DNA-binding GntR family transcriptional regulator